MNKPTKVAKLVQKAKWVLYSGIALNTMLIISALADTPKVPRSAAE